MENGIIIFGWTGFVLCFFAGLAAKGAIDDLRKEVRDLQRQVFELKYPLG